MPHPTILKSVLQRLKPRSRKILVFSSYSRNYDREGCSRVPAEALLGAAEFEGDVDYGFEFYRLAFARGWAKDPAGQGFHGIFV